MTPSSHAQADLFGVVGLAANVTTAAPINSTTAAPVPTTVNITTTTAAPTTTTLLTTTEAPTTTKCKDAGIVGCITAAGSSVEVNAVLVLSSMLVAIMAVM